MTMTKTSINEISKVIKILFSININRSFKESLRAMTRKESRPIKTKVKAEMDLSLLVSKLKIKWILKGNKN